MENKEIEKDINSISIKNNHKKDFNLDLRVIIITTVTLIFLVLILAYNRKELPNLERINNEKEVQLLEVAKISNGRIEQVLDLLRN